MDRREARRDVMDALAAIDVQRARLDALGAVVDAGGDPILSGEIRRYVEKLTTWIDQMYVWAGNI